MLCHSKSIWNFPVCIFILLLLPVTVGIHMSVTEILVSSGICHYLNHLDTIKQNSSLMQLVPSVAKAMRCPLGDISMDVTHCVNGAARTT